MLLVNLLNVFSKFGNPLQNYNNFLNYARIYSKKVPRMGTFLR